MEKNDLLGDIVERRNQFIARDYLGFADAIGIDRKGKVTLIQTTSKSNLSSHRKKIRGNPKAKEALERGAKIVLLGFVKYKGRWKALEEWFTLPL